MAGGTVEARGVTVGVMEADMLGRTAAGIMAPDSEFLRVGETMGGRTVVP